MRDAKLFTIGCGERFRRLSSPLVNNFGKAIRARVRGNETQPTTTAGRIWQAQLEKRVGM